LNNAHNLQREDSIVLKFHQNYCSTIVVRFN